MTPARRIDGGGSAASTELWRVDATLRIGISTCLLGECVRYDGGHKHDRFITQTLWQFVEYVPVCPEVESGMSTPREPVRLVRRDDEIVMLGTKSGRDWTAPMRAWSEKRARQLSELDLCGYVLKKDSPSCGMERVKVRSEKGMPKKEGQGIFAEALIRHQPSLPVEEEGRLHDAALRENFIERIFAYRRLRSFFEQRWSVGGLVAFRRMFEGQLWVEVMLVKGINDTVQALSGIAGALIVLLVLSQVPSSRTPSSLKGLHLSRWTWWNRQKHWTQLW